VLRAPVLIATGDRVDSDHVLPWGARLARHADDVAALARHAFEPLDPGFEARARAAGGGVVVAGERFGEGGRASERAALVLAEIGVSLVLAVSYDEDFRRRLAQAGIPALRFARPADAHLVREGDEVEVPALAASLGGSTDPALRDLTRGSQLRLLNDLDARSVELLEAGGLLALAARGG